MTLVTLQNASEFKLESVNAELEQIEDLELDDRVINLCEGDE